MQLIKRRLPQNIRRFLTKARGFVDSFEEYARLLHLADILPVTSQQDFFGGSVVEAIYCNCHPILPNRLAYTDHIPSALHDIHLYHDIKVII